MTASTITARRKGEPQHYVEKKKHTPKTGASKNLRSFSYILSMRENLIVEQPYGTLASFRHPERHLFAFISHRSFMLFQDIFFSNCMLILYEQCRFVGGPFRIQWAPKWDHKSAKWCKHDPKT